MSAKSPFRKFWSTGIMLALLAGILATSACNTWRGAGKDVERTGEKMQGK
jgi:predicted small secreted protein